MKEYFSNKFSGNKKPLARILGSGIFLAAGLAVAALIFSGFLKVTWQKMAIQKEVNKLKTEKEKLETDNRYLADILDYISSDSFKEREMRLKLNLQKEGEKVIIIYDENGRVNLEENATGVSEGSDSKPNYKKWRDYFFGN